MHLIVNHLSKLFKLIPGRAMRVRAKITLRGASRMKSCASTSAIAEAAEAISRADAIFVTAGAGMGVDSGLPDFRGS